MASSYQQRVLQRKLIYAALILVLLFLAWGWRYAEFSAFGMEVRGVNAQARDLAVREQSRGEVDPIGTLVRLSTIGSRGVATCAIWMNALDAQKKNQWNELELWVRTMTKLQPHYITPWIFQSWNLSYNVSVEADRVSDKYFYITRGVGLLAEGERRNRDNPYMRWSIGFFTQHKICQSDETNTLRSLSQLSMIPPNERDPGRFWVMREGRRDINFKEFEDFCKKHPQLVRRLREGIYRGRKADYLRQFRCERAEDTVQFLADNFRVPSLWETGLPSPPEGWKERTDRSLPVADRFPVLPPRHDPRPHQQPPDHDVLTTESTLRDEDDAYQVARAWFAYSQEPVPPPGDLPGQNGPITDRVRQRIPQQMTTLIFRDYPAQAQRFTAERLQDEGWFDESGWDIPDWFRDQQDKFSDGEPANVGGGHPWAHDAWQKASDLWEKFGKDNHLLFASEADRENMEKRARDFADKYDLKETSLPPVLREEDLDAETRREYFAFQFISAWRHYRHLTNFPHHYNRALVEAKEETVRARKLFFDAEALRLRNAAPRALRKYQEPDALKGWRDKVLLANKEFRRDSYIQETTYEIQLRYLELYAELNGKTFKAQAARLPLIGMQAPPVGACPMGLSAWVAPLIDKTRDNPLLGGPFEGYDDEGVPLIDDNARRIVLQRQYPTLYANAPPSQPPSP